MNNIPILTNETRDEFIKGEALQKLTDEIQDAFFDIPFGNSAFQNLNFIVNAAHTKGRAYRAVGLRMRAKLRALNECRLNLKREAVDIDEINEKLSDKSLNKFERARLEIDLEGKRYDRSDTEKLVNDALQEFRTLYEVFKLLPRYTRDEFEAEEHRHFEIRLKKQAAGLEGAKESLDNMGLMDLSSVAKGALNIPKVLDELKSAFSLKEIKGPGGSATEKPDDSVIGLK